jgi:hypothetical protein
MTEMELTPQEHQELTETKQSFNDWLNSEILGEKVRLYTLGELIGLLYLRLRMNLKKEAAVQMMNQIVGTLERHIDVGDLVMVHPGEQELPYRTAEDFEAHPGLHEMMHDLQVIQDETVLDRELEKFLDSDIG